MLGAVLAASSGCATYPFSENVRQAAQPLTLAEVKAAPAAYTGATVVWGGQVIKAIRNRNGGTLYLLKFPLHSDGKPKWDAVPSGRFIATWRGRANPGLFRYGQLLTIAGEITGAKTEPLQKTEYTYPVLAVEQLHFWYFRSPSLYSPAWHWGWFTDVSPGSTGMGGLMNQVYFASSGTRSGS